MIQFLEWLENSSNVKDDILNWELVKKNALEKEKEQIMKAVEDTRSNIVPRMFINENLNGENYYNQTYNI